jgi:hypothetical protein
MEVLSIRGLNLGDNVKLSKPILLMTSFNKEVENI